MTKAMFVGLSAAFFTAYSVIASALLVPTSDITPITSAAGTDDPCEDAGFLVFPGDDCYRSQADRLGFFGDILNGVTDIVETATSLFSGFFQLIAFNAGLPAASLITTLIFVPLAFINAFIVFGAIRGSS